MYNNEKKKSRYKPYFYVNEVQTKFGLATTVSLAKDFAEHLKKQATGADAAAVLENSFIMYKKFLEPKDSPSGKSKGIGIIVGALKQGTTTGTTSSPGTEKAPF